MSTFKELGILKGSLLIFGGPYSNYAATKAIRDIAEHLDIPNTHIFCTGDLVAYCAEPEQTVDLIRNWGCHVVMGNCEESLAANADDCGCGFDENSSCSLLSAEWYRYSRFHTSQEHKFWMETLPRRISFEYSGKRFLVVHGSTNSINEFVFHSSDHEYKNQQLRQNAVDVIIGGHCGIPFGQQLEQGTWLNAGVIGMPANDGTQTGWYMLISPEQGQLKISWHRLEYDFENTVQAMEELELCRPYSQSLSNGLWPSIDILPEEEADQTGKRLQLNPLIIC
ncbi:MAG: metallophosphoesterase family protein [Neptuniibacter sp.]